jgi:thiol-disulfide isomerase/thioredoxin
MISRNFLRSSAAAVACGLLFAATNAPAATPTAVTAPIPIGQALPDLAMAGLNGPQRSLASFRGRPLIVNVWASWCSPCRKEAASLERLAWSEAGGKYIIIGISTDDDRNAAVAWLRQSNATLSHFIDSGPRWPLEKSMGASTIPLTVLIDAGGRVVARFPGARDWHSADSIKLIERTFAEAARRKMPARKP